MPLDVPLVCHDAGRDQVGPADPLKLGGDLAVVQVGMVTAGAADDLIRMDAGRLGPALGSVGWLTAKYHGPAVPGLITWRHLITLSAASGRVITRVRVSRATPLFPCDKPAFPGRSRAIKRRSICFCPDHRPPRDAGGNLLLTAGGNHPRMGEDTAGRPPEDRKDGPCEEWDRNGQALAFGRPGVNHGGQD